jgi:ABC-type multidrug transport system fused ATPase/permease subunit
MIFDDILSGLDSTTEQLLFQRLFSEQGLLRKLGITTVLATHAGMLILAVCFDTANYLSASFVCC